MSSEHGILYIKTQGNETPLPSDGEIERLIEEAYPGVLASLAFKSKENYT